MRILLISLFLVSCAHHNDVRSNANGTHVFEMDFEEKNGGYDEAKKQADHYCDDVEKSSGFNVVKEEYKYVGSMDEKDYIRAKTISKVGVGAGSAVAVFGGKKQKNAGKAAMIGGGVVGSTTGKGYRYSMKFKCR